MKFTLLTQTALAIFSITGAMANPTPDVSTAGQEVKKELGEATKRYEDDLKPLKAEIDEAMRDKDAETARILQQKAPNTTLQQLVKESEKKYLLVLQQLDRADQRSRDEADRHREGSNGRGSVTNNSGTETVRSRMQEIGIANREPTPTHKGSRTSGKPSSQDKRQARDNYKMRIMLKRISRDLRGTLEQSRHLREEDSRQSQAQFAALSAQHQDSLAATRWDASGS
ncbi:hypothetical protein ACHAP5_011797 [Fusarium lateritium]